MSPGTSQQAVTPSEVDRIAAIADPVLRNSEITLGYHRLALAFAARDPGWANWLMFAVWASRQAGQTIRGEDALITIRRWLNVPADWRSPLQSLWRKLLANGIMNPASRLGRLVRAVPGPLDAVERASDAIGRGNRLVFSDIGRAFAVYLETGQPPADAPDIASAFARYQAARDEPDPNQRAQLQYFGNLEIAFREQARIQELLEEAVDVPLLEVRELGRRVLLVFGVVQPLLAAVAGALVRPFASFNRMLARRLVTEELMTLALPGGAVLRLGRNIEAACPDCLRKLDVPELREFLSRFGGDAADCAATDWTDFDQRMRYVARLFRAYHLDLTLAAEP